MFYLGEEKLFSLGFWDQDHLVYPWPKTAVKPQK